MKKEKNINLFDFDSSDLIDELECRGEVDKLVTKIDSEELVDELKYRNEFHKSFFKSDCKLDYINFKNFLCDIFDLNYHVENEKILKIIDGLLKQIK